MKNHSLKIFRHAPQALARSLLAALVLATVNSPAQTLRMMVPDFLQSASQPPADCLQSNGLPVVLESYPATNLVSALTNDLFSGTPPALAVVPDSALESLDTDGWLYHLTLDQSYSPVRSGTNIVGIRLPWASEWTAIIPETSPQLTLALEVLTNSCIWQRPLEDVEECIALGDLLATNGFTLDWGNQWSTNYVLGGIPVDITVVPTYVEGTNYCRMIIARDAKGKVYAQTEKLSYTMPTTTPVKAATLKGIQSSFCVSAFALQAAGGDPGYCSKPGNCTNNVAAVVVSALEWLWNALTADEKAAVALKGIPKVSLAFNQNADYTWGSRFRAWKIYKAMLTTDGNDWKAGAGNTRTRVRNNITSGGDLTFAQFLIHGFDLKGTQKLTVCPPGYKFWNTGAGSNLTSHLQVALENVAELANSASMTLANGPGIGYAEPDNEEEEENAWFDALHCDIPIDWEMSYDPQTQMLTVSYSVEGKLEWGAYDLCDVALVGAGGATETAKLDGTEVHLEFKLEAYTEAQCGDHPCLHAQMGGGIGAYLDITYPDDCTAVVDTTIKLGWGGHGDALGFTGWVCDTHDLQGPSAKYDLCSDNEVQTEAQNHSDFTGEYGSPVGYTNIQNAFNDYELPPVSGGDTTWDPWWPLGYGNIAISSGFGSDLAASTTFVMPTVTLPNQSVLVTIRTPWLDSLGSASYTIAYDPSALQFQYVSSGSIGLVMIPVTSGMLYPGLLNITNLVTGGVTGAGQLATVSFHTRGPIRRSVVEMVNADFRDQYGTQLDVTHGRGLIDVLHPPITLNHQVATPNLQLTWSSFTNTDYVIQTSTNLTSWQEVTTNAGTGGQLLYETGMSGQSQKFFRLRAAPH